MVFIQETIKSLQVKLMFTTIQVIRQDTTQGKEFVVMKLGYSIGSSLVFTGLIVMDAPSKESSNNKIIYEDDEIVIYTMTTTSDMIVSDIRVHEDHLIDIIRDLYLHDKNTEFYSFGKLCNEHEREVVEVTISAGMKYRETRFVIEDAHLDDEEIPSLDVKCHCDHVHNIDPRVLQIVSNITGSFGRSADSINEFIWRNSAALKTSVN